MLKNTNLQCFNLAVETEGADSFNKSIIANELIELDRITSIAMSLGAKKVSKALYELKNNKNIISHVVSDKSAVKLSKSSCMITGS